MIKNAPTLNPNAKIEELPEVDGKKVIMMTVKIPVMFVSDRSFITVAGRKDDGDTTWICSTSRGTEKIVEENKDKLGSNVVADLHFQCDRITKNANGGIDIMGAACSDLCGSIPDFIKKKAASKGALRLEKQIHFIKTGEVLKDE